MSHDAKPVQKDIIDYLRKPLGELIKNIDQVEKRKIIGCGAARKLITVVGYYLQKGY